jgi:Arc/MetJ-type ribon-helix-helix transcriptional regulator
MKRKISITIEEETIGRVDEHVSEGYFRNKSHFIEFAVNKLLKERENE